MAEGTVEGIAAVLERMQKLHQQHLPRGSQVFLGTYERTTHAIGAAIEAGLFEDPAWVEEWDVVFAELYFDALDAHCDGGRVPRPWRLAFEAPADLPNLRHVLLGINAHINYDLPQALLAVIPVEDFDDPALLDRRRRDHERIDSVLAARVGSEDRGFGARRLRDRALTPLNRRAARRFLAEARRKVWHNTRQLHEARMAGTASYTRRLGELELLSAARIADLLAPGQVVLRLGIAGFGVTLPPPDPEPLGGA